MNQLTGNQLAVVMQAERSMLLASGRAQPPAPPPPPANLTEDQLWQMKLDQLVAEVKPLKFGRSSAAP